MKRIIILWTVLILIPMIASTNPTTCKSRIDIEHRNNGAPFSPVDKRDALKTIGDGHDQISDSEADLLVALLRRSDTEAYSAYDSSDAGYHLLVVDALTCKSLWTGFVQMY